MKKFILAICAIVCIFSLSGCSSPAYERNTQSGEIKQITLSEMEVMIENKETFAIMLTQSRCGYCLDFEELLSNYMKDHHVVMYDVILDQEERSESENLSIIQRYFDGFYSTPGIFYVEEGKSKSQLNGDSNGIDEKKFDDWVVKHKLDR